MRIVADSSTAQANTVREATRKEREEGLGEEEDEDSSSSEDEGGDHDEKMILRFVNGKATVGVIDERKAWEYHRQLRSGEKDVNGNRRKSKISPAVTTTSRRSRKEIAGR